MGIKGIFGEIGSGQRIALAKLAVESIEKRGRPLRIAVDISIWQFQIQASKGGSNPAIRTLYYRLLRLLLLSIQPLFVFDGPDKPAFKRNKKTGSIMNSLSNQMTIEVLRLFGFPTHFAPGEAEAECALFQRLGIVDAVLSEDVDTIMFGSTLTFKNWSSEDRGKTPTHVSVYETTSVKGKSSMLDREGMILAALMSGGDYAVQGIPGCGIKLACEAARAGFGKSLCSISQNDRAAFDSWRYDLAYQIHTNEKHFFKTKHRSLIIPESFPDPRILGYYTRPTVSSMDVIETLKARIVWDGIVDVNGLKRFVTDAFGWTQVSGARKFIRGLAPALLVSKIRARGSRRESGFGDIVYTALNEMELVRSISRERIHFSTDGIPELELVFDPFQIVGMKLEEEDCCFHDRLLTEPPDNGGKITHKGPYLIHDSSDASVELTTATSACRQLHASSCGDLGKVWVPKSIAHIGIPLKVEDWEDIQRRLNEQKTQAKINSTQPKMTQGVITHYLTTAKPETRHISRPLGSASKENSFSTQTTRPPASTRPKVCRKDIDRQISSVDITRKVTKAISKERAKNEDINPSKVHNQASRHTLYHNPPSTRSMSLRRPPRYPVEVTEGASQGSLSVAVPDSMPDSFDPPLPSQTSLAGSFRPPKSSPRACLADSKYAINSQTVVAEPVTDGIKGSGCQISKSLTSKAEISSFWDDEQGVTISQTHEILKLKSPTREARAEPSFKPLKTRVRGSVVKSPPPEDCMGTNSGYENHGAVTIQNSQRRNKSVFKERESLPGSWRKVIEDEREWSKSDRGSRSWRESQVQFLDLSGIP